MIVALLKGKTAVITGGSTGVGLATAKRFVEEGAYVFINGRTQAELDVAVKEIGGESHGGRGGGRKPRGRRPPANPGGGSGRGRGRRVCTPAACHVAAGSPRYH